MQLSDFDYTLPDDLIAQHPLPKRRDARMLIAATQGLQDAGIAALPAQLSERDLVVFNNTRVVPARLQGSKEGTGGRVEILVERMDTAHSARALVRASKTPPPGTVIRIDAAGAMPRVIMGAREGEFFRVESPDIPWLALLEAHGDIPLPPYIQRASDAQDRARYQSLLARHDGAVAAPTASLHFDDTVLSGLRDRGVTIGEVTLHVGAGTFQPVRVDDLRQHRMHSERYSIDATLVAQIAQTRARGGRVVAIGTTVVRALESAAQRVGMPAADDLAGDRAHDVLLPVGDAESELFITPGFRFLVVDALLTNFHLPKSTLLMLVSAFMGYAPMRAAYAHAVASRYRFFSYGDAMWIPERAPTP